MEERDSGGGEGTPRGGGFNAGMSSPFTTAAANNAPSTTKATTSPPASLILLARLVDFITAIAPRLLHGEASPNDDTILLETLQLPASQDVLSRFITDNKVPVLYLEAISSLDASGKYSFALLVVTLQKALDYLVPCIEVLMAENRLSSL